MTNLAALRMSLIKAEINRYTDYVLEGKCDRSIWYTNETLTAEELTYLSDKLMLTVDNPDPAQQILNEIQTYKFVAE